MVAMRKILIRTAISLFLITPALVLGEDKPAAPPAATEASAGATLDGVALQGKIIETMNSNGYTYLQLDASQGKVWVAIPETPVKMGQTVTCLPGMTMNNFTSKTLNRSFEAIVFSPGLDKGTPAAAAANGTETKGKEGTGFEAALRAEGSAAKGPQGADGGATSLGQSTGSAGAVVPSAAVNINKASGTNSFSVGECFEQGKELHGKTVRVRGKVMKISRMIMGKNWLHIQDGTGNPLKNQHDLVVTTTEDLAEGTVVTVEGLLSADRDFGAGYKYEVIVEDAKIEQ
jgi:hypothetical protein